MQSTANILRHLFGHLQGGKKKEEHGKDTKEAGAEESAPLVDVDGEANEVTDIELAEAKPNSKAIPDLRDSPVRI